MGARAGRLRDGRPVGDAILNPTPRVYRTAPRRRVRDDDETTDGDGRVDGDHVDGDARTVDAVGTRERGVGRRARERGRGRCGRAMMTWDDAR